MTVLGREYLFRGVVGLSASSAEQPVDNPGTKDRCGSFADVRGGEYPSRSVKFYDTLYKQSV